MKTFYVVGMAVMLTGCAHEQTIKPRYDQYISSVNAAFVRTASNSNDAGVIARRLCKGDVWEVPQAYQASLKKQQQQRRDGYRQLDPVEWRFSCSIEGAWHTAWKVYGDEDAGKLYREYQKVQRDIAQQRADTDYQLLRRLAKQKGVESNSRVLPDGTIISETYGNGRLCTGVSDEFGSRMSCEEVK